MSKIPKDFETNVFINCPFDDLYDPLFNAIVFAVHDIGFRPRCSKEASNAGQFRLTKIMDIISECKYSIHDLSRTELDTESGLPRFNMPLELGLDLGCKRYGRPYQKEKVCLILDIEPFRYQKFISDISGQDIFGHNGNDAEVIEIIRNWLRLEIDPRIFIVPGGARIFERYQAFLNHLPSYCAQYGYNPKNMQFVDFSLSVAEWLVANPI